MINEALIQERDSLQSEVQGLELKRRRLDLLNQYIATFDQESEKTEVTRIRKRSRANPIPSSGEGLTTAVVELVAREPSRDYTPREIRDILREKGIGSSQPNLITLVTNACKRKAASGVFQKTDRNGQNAYRIVI